MGPLRGSWELGLPYTAPTPAGQEEALGPGSTLACCLEEDDAISEPPYFSKYSLHVSQPSAELSGFPETSGMALAKGRAFLIDQMNPFLFLLCPIRKMPLDLGHRGLLNTGL